MSSLWYPHVKEAPLQGLTGMWGGTGSNLVSGGPAGPPPDGTYTAGAYLIWDPAEYNYEAGQSTINDISGNNRHGQLDSYQNYWQSDNYGIFDTTSPRGGYISNSQGVASPPLTIEAWCRPETTGESGLFDSAPGQTNVLRQFPNDKAEWWSGDPSINVGFQAGNWQHLCFVYKFTGGNRSIRSYRNGVNVDYDTGSTDDASWTQFVIGAYNLSGYFSGDIGVTAVYNSELSQTQIQTNYQARKHRYGL